MARYRRIIFTPQALLESIRPGRHAYVMVSEDIPADARLVHAYYDATWHAFAVVIESASFADLAPGEPPSDILPRIRTEG